MNSRDCVTIPIRTKSEANQHEHWRVKAARVKKQRAIVTPIIRVSLARPSLPCVVKLTRVAPCRLDSDNLYGSFKAVRDSIADWLGIDDRDPRVAYVCEQERGAPKTYAVRVEVISGAVVRTEVVSV